MSEFPTIDLETDIEAQTRKRETRNMTKVRRPPEEVYLDRTGMTSVLTLDVTGSRDRSDLSGGVSRLEDHDARGHDQETC